MYTKENLYQFYQVCFPEKTKDDAIAFVDEHCVKFMNATYENHKKRMVLYSKNRYQNNEEERLRRNKRSKEYYKRNKAKILARGQAQRDAKRAAKQDENIKLELEKLK